MKVVETQMPSAIAPTSNVVRIGLRRRLLAAMRRLYKNMCGSSGCAAGVLVTGLRGYGVAGWTLVTPTPRNPVTDLSQRRCDARADCGRGQRHARGFEIDDAAV